MVNSRVISKTPASCVCKLHLTRGSQLGKYRLEKRLGTGGGSEVWKAKDRVESIWVALKIPQVDVNGQRDNQALLREVRLITKLRHPHIMPVKNADIIDGMLCWLRSCPSTLWLIAPNPCLCGESYQLLAKSLTGWAMHIAIVWSTAMLRREIYSCSRMAALHWVILESRLSSRVEWKPLTISAPPAMSHLSRHMDGPPIAAIVFLPV